MQLVNTVDDFRDMERLAGASEYVMYHIDLRRTLADGPGLAGSRTQSADGFELGFERDLDSMQYSSLDFILLHKRYPPFDSPSGLRSQPRGYHSISTSVNELNDLRTANVQTPDHQLRWWD